MSLPLLFKKKKLNRETFRIPVDQKSNKLKINKCLKIYLIKRLILE